jgi:ElaB/YqjD/DUF883 family membrane-anchored ribosome-binding protein
MNRKIVLRELIGRTAMQSDARMEPKKTGFQGETNSSDGESTGKDFETLRRDVAKLAQTVTDLAQTQSASARGQVMDALGAASEQIAQSAAATQDKMMSLEADLETYVRRNPLYSVLVALGVGFLLGKMSQ